MKRSSCVLLCLSFFAAGCAEQPKSEVTVVDYRNAEGAYVLVYSGDEAFRSMFEDRLVADLAERDFLAYPSYPDLPEVEDTSRVKLLGAAKARKAMFVLIVEEVKPGESGVVRSTNPGRISQAHPTLRDFYEHSRPADDEHDEDEQVFVEVSGFLIEGDYAKLIWSGTTWSFQGDDREARIKELSGTIAQAIEDARRKRRLGFH